jgi:hypothetical protein
MEIIKDVEIIFEYCCPLCTAMNRVYMSDFAYMVEHGQCTVSKCSGCKEEFTIIQPDFGNNYMLRV